MVLFLILRFDLVFHKQSMPFYKRYVKHAFVRARARVGRPQTSCSPTVLSLMAALLFGSLVILDVVCRYLSLFLLYIT